MTIFSLHISISGTLIRRHRVPLPPPNDDQFYTVDHFNVGKEISIYSKVFKIIVSICTLHVTLSGFSSNHIFLKHCLLQGCDEFTRNFLTKLGVRVGKTEEFPEDPYSQHRTQVWRSSLCMLLGLHFSSVYFHRIRPKVDI